MLAQQAPEFNRKRQTTPGARSGRSKTLLAPSLHSLIFSFGGLMQSGTRDALQLWRGVMTGGACSYMIRRLNLALLRLGRHRKV